MVRIFEITSKNETAIIISEINIDFDTRYNEIVNLLSLLIRLKSPKRNETAFSTIFEFENRINQFLNNKMLDQTDPDILELRNKVNKMLVHIDQLKSQLL